MANLQVTDLDFDDIKDNLKSYLSTQTQFSDYNYEGSNLSIILNSLAYNTHYNAMLANLLANEMFLDSAIKRASVVSLAKQLGYTPRSAVAPEAKINITVNNPAGTPNQLTLDKYTPFTTTIDNDEYTFYNLDAVTITPTNGVYTFSDVRVKEGSVLTYNYTVTDVNAKFIIPAVDVDLATLKVSVQTSSVNTTTVAYSKVSDVLSLTPTDTVYFVQENPNGFFEVYFGDGAFGKSLVSGNIVKFEYLVTNKEAANGANLFNIAATVAGNDDIELTLSQEAAGGAEKEDVDSIKVNAPAYHNARGRAVTKEDYSAILSSQVPYAKSIVVWGGEENDPPIYGKVFISVNPQTGYYLTQSLKEDIISTVLKTKNIVSITPEFVDPEFLYVSLNSEITYDPKKTTRSIGELQALAQTAITNHFDNNLGRFGKNLVYSALTKTVDAIDPSIIGSVTSMMIQKRLVPTLNVEKQYNFTFNNKVHPARLTSTRFFVYIGTTLTDVKIVDVPNIPVDYNGTGVLKLVDSVTEVVLNESLGTIDYATGKVAIAALNVANANTNGDIRFNIELQEGIGNVLVKIQASDSPLAQIQLPQPYANQIIVLDDSTLNAPINQLAGLTISVVAE